MPEVMIKGRLRETRSNEVGVVYSGGTEYSRTKVRINKSTID